MGNLSVWSGRTELLQGNDSFIDVGQSHRARASLSKGSQMVLVVTQNPLKLPLFLLFDLDNSVELRRLLLLLLAPDQFLESLSGFFRLWFRLRQLFGNRKRSGKFFSLLRLDKGLFEGSHWCRVTVQRR